MKVNVKKEVIISIVLIIILTMFLYGGLYLGKQYLNGCQGLHDRAYSRCLSSPIVVPMGVLLISSFLFKEFYFLFTTAKRFFGAKKYKELKEKERVERLEAKHK